MEINNTEDPLDNIVFDPNVKRNVDSNSDNSTDPVKTKAKENKDSEKDDVLGFIGHNPDRIDSIQYDNIVEGIEVEDYRPYLGEDIFLPSNGDISALDKSRAINQSFFEQTRNMLGQAVVGEIIGGTVEGLGYLLEIANAGSYASGEEKEWGNMLTDMGQSIRENSQDSMAIYQVNPGEMDFSDSGYWMSNGVSVASTLSMILPSMAGSKILGVLGKFASKGLGRMNKALDFAGNMSKKGKWLSEGISQAVLSRHIENSMEAAGTFRDIRDSYSEKRNPETGELFTEEEAIKFASEAAADNYNAGWAMLLQDIPQYLALGRVFNPKTRKMEKALSTASDGGKALKLKPWQAKTLDFGKTFVSEGFEESYQFYISEKAKTLSDLKAGLIDKEEFNKKMSEAIGSDEMMTSAFFGGLGGNLFQAAGSGINNLRDRKNKDRRENVSKYFEARAKQFAAMQIDLSNSDKMDDPETRESIIEQMMIQQTIEALDNNLFDEHMNTLQQMENMTEEQAKELEAQYGSKFDKNLAKQYIPQAIESANRIRKDYLRHLNKNDSDIAYKLASNDAMSRSSVRLAEISRIKAEELRTDIPYYDKLSETQKQIQESKATLSALDFIIKNYQEKVDKATGYSKDHLQSILNDRIKEREDFVINDLKEINENDTRTKKEKYLDKRRINEYNNRLIGISQHIANEMQHEDNVINYEKENSLIQTKKYQSEFRKKSLIDKTSNIKEEKEIEVAISETTENKNLSPKEKKEVIDALEERKKVIKEEKAEEEKELNNKKQRSELKKKVESAQANNPGSLNNSNIEKIGDNIEDEYGDEESDHTTTELDEAESLSEIESFSNLKINPQASASAEWKEFLSNGKSKVGKSIHITVGKPLNPLAVKALEDFNKGVLNDNVFKNLPLKAELKGNPEAFAYLSAFNKNNENFMTNEYPARMDFIKSLSSRGSAVTSVTYSFGGDLKLSPFTEDGVAPENNPLDILGIDGVMSNVDLVITNEFGQLVGTDKKPHKDYIGHEINVKDVTDEKGNKIGYKGGLFLNVKKADGTPFPLKLNLRKHTEEEANIIADLMTEIIVTKTIKINQRISQIDPEILDTIKEHLSEELKVLKKDPKVVDLLDILVYYSNQTKGKVSELMMSGTIIKFGNITNNGVVAPDNIAEGKANLVDFLMNVKRRQFNLKLWNSSPSYRKYVFDSGVVSTNAVIKQPLFESTDERPINIVVSRLKPSSKKKSSPVKPSKELVSIERRQAMSELTLKNEGNMWLASYFDENGNEEVHKAAIKAHVIKKVSDKYDADTLKAHNPNESDVASEEEVKVVAKKEVKPKKKKSPFEMPDDSELFKSEAEGDNLPSTDPEIDLNEKDDLFDDALSLIFRNNSASTLMIQRKLSISYARALSIIDFIEREGYVSAINGSEPRKILKNKRGEPYESGRDNKNPKEKRKDNLNNKWGAKLDTNEGLDMPDFSDSSNIDDTDIDDSRKKSVSLPKKNEDEIKDDLTKEDFNKKTEKVKKKKENQDSVIDDLNQSDLSIAESIQKENNKGVDVDESIRFDDSESISFDEGDFPLDC